VSESSKLRREKAQDWGRPPEKKPSQKKEKKRKRFKTCHEEILPSKKEVTAFEKAAKKQKRRVEREKRGKKRV